MVLRTLFLFTLLFVETASAVLLPMQPIVSNKTKDFIGLAIVVSKNAPSSDSQFFSIGVTPPSPLIEKATAQLQALGLHTLFYQDRVIGTVKTYSAVSIENSTRVGLSLSWGRGDDTLYLGKNVTYGFKMQWNRPSTGDMREESGFWLEDPISSLIESGTVLSSKKTGFEVTEEILKLAARTSSIEERKSSLDWPEANFPKLKRAQSRHLNPTTRVMNTVLPAQVQKKVEAMTDPNVLNRELGWASYVGAVNANAPLWDQPQAQDYIQGLCDRLVSVPNFPVRCRIFASLAPSAFSYPGGDVFVTAGLLSIIPNEDALVFFLSHEISHVLARHFTENLRNQQYQRNLLNTLAVVTSVLSVKVPLTQLYNTLGDVVSTSSIQKVYTGMMSNYSKENELEADQLGFQLAESAGFSREKMIEGLTAFQQTLKTDFASSKAVNFEVHYPAWDQRLANLRDMPKTESTVAGSAPSSALEGFKAILRSPYEYFRIGSIKED
jgi:Zn-dependent protease with chaperone function